MLAWTVGIESLTVGVDVAEAVIETLTYRVVV
jgi:hypothetical protein